jgi:hypothetical protein
VKIGVAKLARFRQGTNQGNTDTGRHTMTNATKFLAQNPTLLATYGEFKIYEHPTRGDSAPVYMVTPIGRLVNTGFYDLGDFDLDLCIDLATDALDWELNYEAPQ